MLQIRTLSRQSSSDRAAVLRIFMESAGYTDLVEGRPPGQDDVDDFFSGKPPGKRDEDKVVFGVYEGDDIVGCAEMLHAYPTKDCAWIGLLLFAETYQGRGHGKAALALLNEVARSHGYCKVQLATVATNSRGHTFWRREGFVEIRRVDNERFTGELIVMERRVDQPVMSESRTPPPALG